MPDPRHILLKAALVLSGLAGCGEAPAPPSPDAAPATAETSRVQPPAHGVVYVEAVPRTAQLAEQFKFDPLAEAQLWLTSLKDSHRLVVQAGDEFDQPGRLRFWFAISPGSEDQIEQRATGLWERLHSAVDEKFRGELAAHQKWLELETATAREATASAQTQLRDYLASRRGVPATAESRREQARLEYVLSKAVEELDAITSQAQRVDAAVASPPPALRRTN